MDFGKFNDILDKLVDFLNDLINKYLKEIKIFG